jgi:hypothetical protein
VSVLSISLISIPHLNHLQLRPLDSLRRPCSSQSLRTLEPVGPFPSLHLSLLFRRSATSAAVPSPVTHAHASHTHTHFTFDSSAVVFRALRSRVDSETNAQPPLDCRSYAFVEFRSTRDAEDAYYDMLVLYPLFLFVTLFPMVFFVTGTVACLRVLA